MSSFMSRVSDDLVAREEEYLRINAEIEQKTRLLEEEVANLSMDNSDVSHVDLSHNRLSREASVLDNTGFMQPPLLTPREAFQTEVVEDPIYVDMTDVIPKEAQDLSHEATLRLLKAKVRVLEEEVTSLTLENSKQKQTLVKNKQLISADKEEQIKLHKTISTLQVQLEKSSNLADEKKKQNKVLELDVVKLRKDLEAMERADKKSGQSQKTLEVRLDRALEEVEKHKGLLGAERAKSSESSHMDRETFNNLTNENKILHKQKSELINAYKKQMKLIDVLRKQKLHLEASRMLSFTQEEFMKVLDWKNA